MPSLIIKGTLTQITSYRLGYTSQRPYPWRWATPVIPVVFLWISVFLSLVNIPLSAYEIVQESTYRPNDTLPPLPFSWLVPAVLQSPEDVFPPHVLTIGDNFFVNNSVFNFTIISAQDENSAPVSTFSYYNNPFSDGCDISNMTIIFDLAEQDISSVLSVDVKCLIPTPFRMTLDIKFGETPATNPLRKIFNGLWENLHQMFFAESFDFLGIQAFTSNATLMQEWADIVHLFNTTDRVPVISYLRPVPRLKPLGSALTSVFVSTFAMVSVLWTVFSLVAGAIAARSENGMPFAVEDRLKTYGMAIARMELALKKRGLFEDDEKGGPEASTACTSSQGEKAGLVVHCTQSDFHSAV
ncbi:hypothetical protein C8R46DRAFT_1221640 [Mycena filopes]|nr:hypothetical protein C8R46DRAFT_1221640 [Mycena filopes]